MPLDMIPGPGKMPIGQKIPEQDHQFVIFYWRWIFCTNTALRHFDDS